MKGGREINSVSNMHATLSIFTTSKKCIFLLEIAYIFICFGLNEISGRFPTQWRMDHPLLLYSRSIRRHQQNYHKW